MSKNKKAVVVTAATLATTVFLSGCGLFGGEEKKKIDPPQDVTLMENGEALDENVTTETKENGKEAVETSIQTELYLIDKNGYVVSQTMELPKTESVAKQALEYLVANGPVEQMLPNGFRAVLPADTQMTLNIKDGTATVDFSKEFATYKKEDEKRILQAVTWTLTQFDSIDEVKLQMNGTPLEAMPVNGTPIGEELSRADGINVDNSDVVDITNTKAVTVYYIGGEEGAYYYVPVTKRVSNDQKDNITAIVNELVEGPAYASNLLSDFQSGVKLLDEPKIEDGKVTLNFNESIFGSLEEKMVSEHLLNSLVLSLTEQEGVKSVALTVNGKADVLSEKGEKLAEPVTRPEKVNTGSF
ncbi:GerMN domain-containing protein [Mesobacillus sp. AQ2]|uniref:GerMN domain-containing protein n=1 Tax=Bacillaceae TaxID=186817 RepID=UPI0011A43732|nr:MULTISPECIES: GerMN domain-containing protein [Bacillaceae]MCM3122624.1 GerMN domain-containing protein [Mesobacillus sp. MER 33]MCM3232588.1 GerMN domain-containing protein [Mesobacillus sp. MER 48]WHX39519.1 GerMN domain-containing protein [Mesobacillus sp. AQ2]